MSLQIAGLGTTPFGFGRTDYLIRHPQAQIQARPPAVCARSASCAAAGRQHCLVCIPGLFDDPVDVSTASMASPSSSRHSVD